MEYIFKNYKIVSYGANEKKNGHIANVCMHPNRQLSYSCMCARFHLIKISFPLLIKRECKRINRLASFVWFFIIFPNSHIYTHAHGAAAVMMAIDFYICVCLSSHKYDILERSHLRLHASIYYPNGCDDLRACLLMSTPS